MRSKLLAALLMLTAATTSINYPKTITTRVEPEPCVVGHTSAPIGFWTWPANSHVNIYLREPDFSPEYVSAVELAIENWDAAAVENGSNVHFSFRGLTRETTSADGDLTIIRGDVYNSKIKHLAVLQAHSLKSNQLIDYAVVIVDSRVKNPEVLTNIVVHELGHSLGLLDCNSCSRKGTAMSLLKSGNESNGIEGPTVCDKMAVLSAYRDLALRVRAAPTVLTDLR